jgi:hypothetical protein
MIIMCTTEQLLGETAYVDRETEAWFERDHVVQGYYAVMIFPKMCWRRTEELVVQ